MPSRDSSAAPPAIGKPAGSGSMEADGRSEETRVEMDNMEPKRPQLPIEEDLMGLARLGELRAVQKLFDSGKYNANSADDQGITALHWAAINGHVALCHFLLQAGANVNAKGGDAEATPVLWASKKCNLEVVNLLLQNGADPLITDDQGYNLLHCATLDGNVFQLVLLLHQPDIPVDIPDSQGHTSLMWAAYKGYPACVDVLLKWGANVGATDNMGFTALHWALVKGSYPCIQRIVEYGADRFAANNEGKTPAVTAQEMNSTRQWLRALADSGFDAAGQPREFPLPFIKDQRWAISRFFFLWPFVVLGAGLYILAFLPVYIGVPMALLVLYGLQWLAQRVLKWAPSDMKHLHKTPFLAGVFAGSLAWVGIRWITKILRNTWSSSFFTNLAFAACYCLTLYFYSMAVLSDPGYVPKSGSRGQQKGVIDELLSKGTFDEQHFCTACMIRKPLRSKHCKRCNRCVAREDHHCPWVDNCVGVNNHRHFVLYIFFLLVGIALLVRLTLSYIEILPTPNDDASTSCTFLKASLCAHYNKDPFTLLTNAWASLQLTWTTMLLFVQLTQIARAMTTYESMRGQHPGALTTALATGSTSLDSNSGAGPLAAGPAGAGAGAEQGSAPAGAHGHAPPHPHAHRESCFAQWKKLLGLDTFIATAMHGSKAGEVMARRRRNPFTRGVLRNCQDFWCDGSGAGVLGSVAGKRESGVSLLGGDRVDYRRLYDVPAAGMRYRRGGEGGGGGAYEALPVEEEV